jgi:hypothetical protein
MSRRWSRGVRAGASLAMLAAALVHPGSAAAQAPATDAADARYQAGIRLYLEKDYTSAARELALSYAASPRRETLFAWAQAERLQGNCVAAQELYKKYIELGPPPAQAELAARHLAHCQEIAPPPWYHDAWGDLFLGAGAAAILAGGVFLSFSIAEAGSRSDAPNYSAYADRTQTADQNRTIGYVALGAGAALVSAGILRFLLRPAHATSTALAPLVGPGLAGVQVTGQLR